MLRVCECVFGLFLFYLYVCFCVYLQVQGPDCCSIALAYPRVWIRDTQNHVCLQHAGQWVRRNKYCLRLALLFMWRSWRTQCRQQYITCHLAWDSTGNIPWCVCTWSFYVDSVWLEALTPRELRMKQGDLRRWCNSARWLQGWIPVHDVHDFVRGHRHGLPRRQVPCCAWCY